MESSRILFSEHRNSGIPLIGDLAWGTDFCVFHETRKDLAGILAPFFRAGILGGELCVWVAPDPPDAGEASQALQQALPEFKEWVGEGRLEIIPRSRWRARDGDAGGTILSKLDQAILGGFAGLRLAWDVSPEAPGGHAVAPEEKDVLSGDNVLSLFSFPRARFDAASLMQTVKNHRFALVQNRDRWEIIESSEAGSIKDALKRSEEKLHSLFANMSEGFAHHRIVLDAEGRPRDAVFREVNDAFERITGLKKELVIGKKITEVFPGIEKDPADWIGTFGRVALTGEPTRVEAWFEPHRKWVSVSAFCPHKGQFALTFSDITERRKAEEEVRRSTERFKLLSQVTAELLVTRDPQALVERLCRDVMEHLGCDCFFNFLDHPESGRLLLNACAGIPPGEVEKIRWLDYGAAVCGCAARDGCRIIVEDIFHADDPRTDLVRSYGIQAYCCHPLLAEGRVIGTLSFGARNRARFTAQDVLLMKTVADKVAVAMGRIMDKQALEEANRSLERRVAERTRDIEALYGKLKEASRKIIDVQENERRAVAQDLHDSIGAGLAATKFSLESQRAGLEKAGMEQASASLGKSVGMIVETMEEVRRISRAMWPSILRDLGLGKALHSLAREFEQAHPGTLVERDLDPACENLPKPLHIVVYRVVQEALNNAAKHAGADRVALRLAPGESGKWRLSIRDNGNGFAREDVLGPGRKRNTLGLSSMRDRVEVSGGAFNMASAPGKGTEISAEWEAPGS